MTDLGSSTAPVHSVTTTSSLYTKQKKNELSFSASEGVAPFRAFLERGSTGVGVKLN